MCQTFGDQRRPDILSACSQHAARPPIIATRRSFGPGAASAGDFLQIEATSSDELPKPERGPVSKLPLRWALRPVGLGCVETNEPKGFAFNANCVAVRTSTWVRSTGEAFAMEMQ
jgi:hypothetical protein